jgi:hypothetical protein
VALGPPPAAARLPAFLPLHRQNVKQTPAPKAGPDPAVPHFVNYALGNRNPTIPKDTWGPVFSAWNHYGTVCVCPNGDVLAAWYTTVDEAGRELAQAASRLRAGSEKWDPATVFLDVPDVNDHAPVLMSDGKRLYHFATQSLRGWDNAADIMRWSDDSGATWSRPQIILARDRPDSLSQPCSAFVDKDGSIVLACDGDGHRDERLLIGVDGGKTWRVAKGDLRKAAGKYAIHPAVAPTADGDGVIAFLRGPDPMAALVSRDRGDTWAPLAVPFGGISVGQKAAALRLAGGGLLLISLDNRKKLVGGGTFAALSPDDGKTWPHVRKLEGVTGYMSAAQAPDGTIYVFGTRMSCVAFNEAWLKRGKPAE